MSKIKTVFSEPNIIASVRQWVNNMVVGLNLCPFAERELINNRVRFVVTEASTEEQLLQALQNELELLGNDSSIETTLLIHSEVLQDFYHYNQFLELADELLVQLKLIGIYQIASFHPQYQFSDTAPDDAENYSNRSPYPILHLLREASLERVIKNHAGVEQIPGRNIALLNRLGVDKLRALCKSSVSR